MNGYRISRFTHAWHSLRLPSIDEPQTILLAPFPCGTSPCIDPIFGPTVPFYYWSSTSFASAPVSAWLVSFSSGIPTTAGKTYPFSVRAVRGGS